MACASVSSVSSSASSGWSFGPRMSRVSATSPGMTLTAPGAQRSVPTVATRFPPCSRVSVSISTIHSAAAASASFRWLIGTVPACPASPVKRQFRRRAPLIASTTPKASPSCSRHGPCSICSSRYAAISSWLRAAR